MAKLKYDKTEETLSAQKDFEAAKDRLDEIEAQKPGDYKPSQEVNDAKQNAQSAADKLQQIENQKPGAYESQYSNQIDELLNSILNREDFTYDINADPLYNQYREQYVREGNNAMRDTMGQAAGLTGGYGSSYSGIAGSQAYDSYLQKLNDKVPELYQLAYQKYRDEGDDLYNQLGVVQGLEQDAYGRYRDTVSDWQGDRDYYAGRYDAALNQSNYLSEQDYQRYQDIMNQYNTDREYYAGRVDAAGNRYDTRSELDHAYAQLAQNMSQFNQQMALENKKLEETIRANKAQEALSRARLSRSSSGCSSSSASQDLMNDASIAEAGSAASEAVQSANTDLFQASIRTSSEFNRRGGSDKQKYGSYKQYVAGKIYDWTKSGKLTQGEARWLSNKYNLGD